MFNITMFYCQVYFGMRMAAHVLCAFVEGEGGGEVGNIYIYCPYSLTETYTHTKKVHRLRVSVRARGLNELSASL